MYCRGEAGCVGWLFLGCVSVLSGYYLDGLGLCSVRLLKQIIFVFYPARPARKSQLRYYEVFSARSAESRVESNHVLDFPDIQEQTLMQILPLP
jgi:hypothetical protein